MVLYTKCILKPKEDSDGTRICIMSRLTLNDGVTPDYRLIEEGLFDQWIKELAPEPKLLGDYYKRGLDWADFEKRYISYIQSDLIRTYIESIGIKALKENVTILCIEESCEFCHRRLVADECKRLFKDLIVIHI